MTPTPETLRGEAERARCIFDAAADAWEADLQRARAELATAEHLHELSISGYQERMRAAQARAEALENATKTVALAIGDRTHGAMASECQKWRETLEHAALARKE